MDKLRKAIKRKRPGLLTAGVVLMQDNATPHTSRETTRHLERFKWKFFAHPLYSPDLAPSDYHLFPALKRFLGGKRFVNDEELKNAVKEYFEKLDTKTYTEGIEKLVPRYDKCLNLNGDYVEK